MTRTGQVSTISKGTYNLFVGNLVYTVILAITSIILGRLLGPGEYGLYTIAIIVPTYVYLALRLGTTSTITRHAAKYLSEGDEKRAVSFSYTISIFHLALGLLVVVSLVPFTGIIATDLLHRPNLSTGLVIPVALFSVVGQIMFFNGTGAFVGLHSFGKSAIFQNINAIVKLVVSVSLVLVGYSVLGAIAGYTFGFMVAGMMSLIVLVFMNKSAIPRNIKQDIAMGMGYAWPIYLSTLFSNAIPPVQNTILAYTVSNAQIGWYSQAVNISSLIILFTYPVTTVLLPLFSRTVSGGMEELSNTYRLTVKYTALLVTPAATLVTALSKPLAIALLGHAYANSGSYLLVMSIVYLFSGLGYISWSAFLYGVGETWKAFLATAAGSVVAILTSIVLVFYAGVYGIIVGTILGQVVSLIFGSRFVSQTLGTDLKVWSVWRVYLSSALGAIIVYPVSLFVSNPYIAVVGGGALFVLVMVPIMTLTGALTRQDLKALQQQFNEVGIIKRLLSVIGSYQNLFVRE